LYKKTNKQHNAKTKKKNYFLKPNKLKKTNIKDNFYTKIIE